MNPLSVSTDARSWLSASLVFVAYLVLLFVGSRWLPGRRVLGRKQVTGAREEYTLNGLRLFLVVILVSTLGIISGRLDSTFLYDRFWELFAVANLFCLVLAGCLSIGGEPRGRKGLAEFWYGAQLSPRLWGVELKVFSYRPSLIGWWLFNLTFACVQYERMGRVTAAMALYLSMTTLYLLFTFLDEEGLLSMYDVIEERFGFMLVWGDYVVVPFFYCLPGYFLIDQAAPLSPVAGPLLCLLFAFGFWLFRGANRQKYQFKTSPHKPIWGKSPETLGGRLLVSGFWGIGRKLNYTGEILIYLSWTLVCGFSTAWPYLLPLWLACLLVHRAWRDDKRCRAKYGQLWDEYCRRVRFRMFPLIY